MLIVVCITVFCWVFCCLALDFSQTNLFISDFGSPATLNILQQSKDKRYEIRREMEVEKAYLVLNEAEVDYSL